MDINKSISNKRITKEFDDYQTPKPIVLKEKDKIELALVWRGDVYRKYDKLLNKKNKLLK